MSDDVLDAPTVGGHLNGEVLDSPTVNSFVVSVEIVPPTPPPPSDLPGPRPAVGWLEPPTGLAGESFTLHVHGTGFTEAAEVLAGGRPAKSYRYVSMTQIDVDVDGTGITDGTEVGVAVVDATGMSNTVPLLFSERPPDPPHISSLDPTSTIVGDAPLTLHIAGTGYTSAVQVWMGGVAVNTGYVSATQVDTAVDPTTMTAGNTDVWVVDAGGQSNTATFKVWPAQ